MNLKIREILPKDNQALAELIRYNLKNHGLDIKGTVYFDEGLDRLSDFYIGSDTRGYFVLVDDADRVLGGIGFAEFPDFKGCAELQKLYLADEVKGKGYGYKLIEHVEKKMMEKGFTASYLETHENLKVALHTYEKSGYKQIERPKSVMHGAMTHFYFKELGVKTMEIIKVSENIYKIHTPYKDIFTTVSFIKTDKGVMIFDAASFENDVEDFILPAMNELGIKADDVKYIFISHNHSDHSGALMPLIEKLPEAVVVSRSEALHEKCSNFLFPADDETLLGVLRVVTIKGHTDDSMAVFDTRTKTLVTGDCFQVYGIFGSGDWGVNIGYPVEYLADIEKVRKLSPNTISAAHIYHPCGQIAEGESDVNRFLDLSAEPLMKIKELILDNPNCTDEELKAIYNAPKTLPTIGIRPIKAVRDAMNAGEI